MIVAEKTNKTKFFMGLFSCGISALITNLVLGSDPTSSNLFWIAPGLIFGLALIIPNLSDVNGLKWKIISLISFPLVMWAVWMLNLVFANSIGNAVSDLCGLTTGIAFIGISSALIAFGAINFFFQRKIKLLNYCIVALCGGAAFITINILYLTNGEGMVNHFDKLIYAWQILVGTGISLSFKKENLEVFIA